MENARELDGVIHRYISELSVRYRTGIRPEAKNRRVLARERP